MTNIEPVNQNLDLPEIAETAANLLDAPPNNSEYRETENQSVEPLTVNDREWLEKLGCYWPTNDEEDWLTELNNEVRVGSEHLRANPDRNFTDQQVMDARKDFFNRLPVISEAVFRTYLSSKPHRMTLMPVDTFIASQRVMTELGLDAARLVAGDAPIAYQKPDAIRKRVSFLLSVGIDPRILRPHQASQILASRLDFQERLEFLKSFDLPIEKILKHQPTLLVYSDQKLKNHIDYLSSQGINVKKVAGFNAAILSFDPANIEAKIARLKALGIDAVSVANRMPSILCQSTETYEKKVEHLHTLGLNAALIINQVPAILGYAPESVSKKVQLVNAIGRMWGLEEADSLSIINRFPQLISYKPQKLRTLARIVNRSLPSHPKVILDTHIKQIVIQNLEATIVGYLLEKDEIKTPRDIARLSKRHSYKLGKSALQEIINQHPNDPIVKSYLKGYPAK